MTVLRIIAGILALAALGYAMNLALLQESIFDARVLIALACGAALTIVWFVLQILTMAGTARGATLRDVNMAIGTVSVLGICVVVFAFAQRHDREWDLTREGRASLAPQTVQVLESLTSDVEAYAFFVNTGDPLTNVTREKARRFLERCSSYSDDFNVIFIDPQREPEMLEAMNVLRVSENGTIVLRCGARQRELPISRVTGRIDERAFTNALVSVARESVAKVYFLSGHGERDIESSDPKTGAKDFRLWLEKESYKVAPLVISPDRPAVPADCDALIINGFESDLAKYEIDALDAYIDDGGRLMLLADPQIVVSPAGISTERLRPWLRQRFGIEVHSDILVSRDSKSFQTLLLPDFSGYGDEAGFVEPDENYRGSYRKDHPITAMLDKQMVLSLTRTIRLQEERPEGVDAVVLLRTGPGVWAEENLSAIVRRQPVQRNDHELEGLLPVAVAAAWAPEQEAARTSLSDVARVVVVGDAGLSTNEALNIAAHQDFLLNAIAWLTEQEQLISIRQTVDVQQPVLLTDRDERKIAWLTVLGVPQFILAAGVVTYLWRRRYR